MKNIERTTHRNAVALFLGAAAVVFMASACGPKRETVVRHESVAIHQPAVPQPPRTIDISIVDLHDEPAPDPSQEKVVGTIVNAGDKAVSGLSIKVNALNSAGQIVRSITTPPLRETIAPGGGRTRFEAFMPADAAVAGYHAVAIAK